MEALLSRIMMKLPLVLLRSKFLKKDLACMIHSSSETYAKLNVCVVGSGPAGFFTAKKLISENEDVHVDIYEKLPTPFGLIRYGVAPDSPEVKGITGDFTNVIATGRCNFYGNVNIGKHVFVKELLKAYNAVVLAYGASNHKDLDIIGKAVDTIVSANSFVGWYNGHPQYVEEKINLDNEVAVIIGQGNVALDIARILLRRPEELKKTEISEHALAALEKSRIRRVYLIGKRGPLNAAFSLSNFQQIVNLAGCQAIMHPKDFEGVPEMFPPPENRKTLLKLMLEVLETSQKPDVKCRLLDVKFFRSPRELSHGHRHLEKQLRLTINEPEGSPGSRKIIMTDSQEFIYCGLVIKSIGFRRAVIDAGIPFDLVKYSVPHEHGRVLGNKKGLYCSGWLKTGPKGVIPKTMSYSYETADTILSDFQNGESPTDSRPGSKEILKLLRSRGMEEIVSFDQWQKIDRVELLRGEALGKARKKIVSVTEMLKVALRPFEESYFR